MAVIQISRIQIRRGVADSPTPSGLPQLASGEMGWATDQQRLWIGSGSIAEGAPAVSNVEVLTAQGLLNILETFTATNYTYRLDQGTGGGTLGSVQRSIQEKLDDTADALDFGIMGDGITDDTAAINNAIYELYVGNQGVNDGPILNFHPGNFLISGPIYLPSFTKLKGSGIGKSTFTMMSSGTYMHSVFQTVGLSSSGTSYVSTVSIVSPNFPGHINIEGFKFQFTSSWTTTQTAPLISLDSTQDSIIRDCSFVGTYASGKAWNIDDCAIQLTNAAPAGHNNVTIENCLFNSISVGILSNNDIDTVRVENNKFYNNYHGAYFGYDLSGNTPAQTGPKNVHFVDNLFSNETAEAIYVGTTATNSTATNIVSMNNTYRAVGVDNLGDATSPVLTFLAPGASSINDNFERIAQIQATSNSDGTYSYVVDPTVYTTLPLVNAGNYGFNLKFRTPFKQNILINDNTQNNLLPLANIPYPGTSLALIAEYVYTGNSGDTRTGKLLINAYNSTVTLKDEFSYCGSDSGFGQLEFTASITNGVLQILGSRIGASSVHGTLSLTVTTLQ